MTGILLFFRDLLGLEDFQVPLSKIKRLKAKNNTQTQVILSLEDKPQEDEYYWWENPVIRDESAEFEETGNSVLYDELKMCLEESRLEVIELPETISSVLGIIHRKHFWYSEVVSLIHRSPALTGDFLSIVNSAAFSRGLFIYDLDLALPRLGRKKIQSILFLNASKMSIPETPLFAKVIEEIIDESQAVAKICRLLAPVFSIDANEAFLAGLLHNIGKIGLLKQISNHYNVPDDLDIEYHQSLFKSILPVFAARAAEKIGQYWKLDKRIIQAISKHSELNSLIREGFRIEDVKLIALVNLSIYIARILGFGESLSNGADIFGQVSSKVLGMSDTPAYRLLLKNLSKAFSEEELPKVAVA